MAPKLDPEAVMTIKTLAARGASKSSIARSLGVSEGSVRYHLRRIQEGAVDGRRDRAFLADGWRTAMDTWVELRREDAPLNLAELHAWLVEEHAYRGSLRSIQRYFRARHPRPKLRARRRIETPPGAQAQVDWAHFSAVRVDGTARDLLALHMQLSHSRHDAIIWSQSKDQLGWHAAHNGALTRLGGVPATLRVDNEKTAIVHGAGAWGEINPAYRSYAKALRFHVDACPPRAPEAKGKVERRIRDHRLQADPSKRHWCSLEELQTWTDEAVLRSSRRRVCPATGTSVLEAWHAERRHLSPLPILPEPFDVVVQREVGIDCTVAFEGRVYSVPFRFVGRRVEVRGCAGEVQVFAEGGIVAAHERGSERRILLEPAHYEGDSTERVIAPLPLGRMGRRLQEIAELVPEKRPVDLYAALAGVAR